MSPRDRYEYKLAINRQIFFRNRKRIQGSRVTSWEAQEYPRSVAAKVLADVASKRPNSRKLTLLETGECEIKHLLRVIATVVTIFT